MATASAKCALSGCAKSIVEKHTCPRCHRTPYCSNKHQKADWKTHKAACKRFQQETNLARKAVHADIKVEEGSFEKGFKVQKIVIKGPVAGGAIYDAQGGELELNNVTFSESKKLTFLRAYRVTFIGQITISGNNPNCGLFIQASEMVINSPVTITCAGPIMLEVGELILNAGIKLQCSGGLTLRKCPQIKTPDTEEGLDILNTEVVKTISQASIIFDEEQTAKKSSLQSDRSSSDKEKLFL